MKYDPGTKTFTTNLEQSEIVFGVNSVCNFRSSDQSVPNRLMHYAHYSLGFDDESGLEELEEATLESFNKYFVVHAMLQSIAFARMYHCLEQDGFVDLFDEIDDTLKMGSGH